MSCLLGLDYGLRRIGIAASDESGTLASAVGVHDTAADGSIYARLEAIISERGVDGLVIGLPLTADGRETEMAGRARAFAAKLSDRFGLPVELVDERFSSAEAERWLSMSGRRRRPKGEIDAMAAEIILQHHLDSLR